MADAHRLLSIVGYVQGDYHAAVADKRVINPDEYDEMLDFTSRAVNLLARIEARDGSLQDSSLASHLGQLVKCVRAKCSNKEIIAITGRIKEIVKTTFAIASAPKDHPNLARGKEIYLQACASCHGSKGDADTPLANTLNPPPRSFFDAQFMATASPFKFFNTLQTGISGTTMRAYAGIYPSKDLWSVSFYLLGLRYSDLVAAGSPKAFVGDQAVKTLDLDLLSASSDSELGEWLAGKSKRFQELSDAEKRQWLGWLRLRSPYERSRPLRGSSHSKDQPAEDLWGYIGGQLESVQSLYSSGDRQAAGDALLDAYLDGFEKIERQVRLLDAALATRIEQQFSRLRSYVENAQTEKFRATLHSLHSSLSSAKELGPLGGKQRGSSYWLNVDFLAALLIILREGLEAFLIVVALLLVVKNMGVAGARRWIHAGWIAAVVAGYLSYLLFEKVIQISGAQRELIEAVVTGFAMLVLFYTGFWLLSNTEQRQWGSYLRAKTRGILTRKHMYGLTLMSFLAVFREAAETVLFYSALYSSASSPFMISCGFLVGLSLLLLLCFAILKFEVKLPLGVFFRSTSFFMLLLSVVLCGKAVNELIAAGYLTGTPLEILPTLDFLGVYPQLQTLGAQLLMLALTALIYSRLAGKSSTVDPQRPSR